MTGIVSWGAYIPRYRITAAEIAAAHGVSAQNGLLISEKSVAAVDEDAVTMAVEASREALRRMQPGTPRIGAVFFGSESHPYAVKPTGTIVTEALGLGTNVMSADMQFACKAGTAALQVLRAMVASGQIEAGIGGGTDTAQGAPGEPLEYSAAAGAAAFVVGDRNVVAEMTETCSYTTDTPDFWRRQTQQYPRHAGWFTGAPAYFRHVENAARTLMEKAGTKPAEYDYVVIHQPNGKFPRRAAQALGFRPEQYEPGMLVGMLGNTYAAASLLGLISVLEQAKADQKILLVSYGSGAGADAFHIETQEGIEDMQTGGVHAMLRQRRHLTYGQYLLRTGGVKA